MNHYNLRPRVQRIEPINPKNDDKCSICLELLSYNNRKIYTTHCGHTFHTICFNQLQKETCNCCNILMLLRVNCPNCRTRTTFEPKYRLTLCRKNLQNINYAIMCEEMKIMQMFDYSGIKNQVLNLKKQLKSLLKSKKSRDGSASTAGMLRSKGTNERSKTIEGIKTLIEMYEEESKYMFEIIKNSTQTLHFHRENIEAHIQAHNEIISSVV